MGSVPQSKADHNDRPNYRLSFLTIMTSFVALFLATTLSLWLWPWTTSAAGCSSDPTRFTLSDLPYINYFYSDCHSAAQVIVRSPLPGSLLDIVTPRLLVAWPAGNSGLAAFFEPQNGVKGSLAVSLVNSSTTGNALEPVYEPTDDDPIVGVSGQISFNTSAKLTVPILGSIRTLRGYTEGGWLDSNIQNTLRFFDYGDGSVTVDRPWFDNVTTMTLSFSPSSKGSSASLSDRIVEFTAGTYVFNASFNYPQLTQLQPSQVLTDSAHDLIADSPDQTKSLSFLSYSDKLLAGAWRFLTYFGRDSMISMLLLKDILSAGEGSAFEAGVIALLERIDRSDGSVAHEETIGDYATYLNKQAGLISTAPLYDYKMVDTDFFLPILLAEYFINNPVGKNRVKAVLDQVTAHAEGESGTSYRALATLNADKILRTTAPFAAKNGQVKENLIRLKDGESVGEWRDSSTGLGGGRIPYDVNTALAPAGLYAIATLADAGFFPDHPTWADDARKAAKIWEDKTLEFFEVSIPRDDARSLVDSYVSSNNFPFPSESGSITGDVHFYGLALDGSNNQPIVKIMNTDDCFRHFLLNSTDETQLTAFVSQTADNILAPFPVGLTTDAGLLVSNPAYTISTAGFGRADYHGTVVWGWQLSMMAKGLEHQLGRCEASSPPEFCQDSSVHIKVINAYNKLWDVIEENTAVLSNELWTWKYEDGRFDSIPLGELSSTESNISQLWSLTFLAVRRNEGYRNKAEALSGRKGLYVQD
uniref:Glycogen debranching enzyme n=2 Tax=Bionectria ochroleuca TaxID=29856 RepID=A0A0B7K8D2_BIOOC